MSGQTSSHKRRVLARAVLIALLALGAAGLGLWLGELSVPAVPPAEVVPPPPGTPRTQTPPDAEFVIDPDAPPLYFYADPNRGGEWLIVEAEIGMAAKAGVHRCVVAVNMPWADDADLDDLLEPVTRVVAANPKAVLLLKVNLNPPEEWLRAHMDEVARIGGQTRRYCTPASPVWLDAARLALDRLITAVDREPLRGRVLGYVLCALQDGAWQRPGWDESPASREGFRAWLRGQYVHDDALREAWGDAQASMESAMIPAPLDTADTRAVFFHLPEEAEHVDFLRYTSESTADAIAALCVHVKAASPRPVKVFAPYGYTYETARNDAGHLGLGLIIASDLDGFVAPVSYTNRGLGGAGSVMGPVTSALFHGKEWLVVDDTRTGVGRDPETGVIARMKGLRGEDVFHVQQRNFAAALIMGLGLVWADPEGKGWLHDEEQWKEFARMYATYADTLGGEREINTEAPAELENPIMGRPPFSHARGLAVVVDEMSRFHQRCDETLNDMLLHQTVDAAVRSGMPTRFCLLQDVLDDRIAPAPVYLFLNAFFLSDGDRQRLHEILEREQAAAIWMYAPGYINERTDAANITATTRMTVKQFDGATKGGSYFSLPGPWVHENEPFGQLHEWSPLFFMDDPKVDILARYIESGKASLGIKFLDEGWASVYVAEPTLTPPVLREVLRILEQPLYFREGAYGFFDSALGGRGLLAIHAQESGERVIDLGRYYDVQDLFDARIGWPQKRSFVINLNIGETRLLQLTPIPIPEAEEFDVTEEGETPQDDSPEVEE
ncbi:MAG TPA: beta-galactosidase [Candidatus Hydrogenedentes bacterium]|nr:beta-galactosidase [Candidatus Hydrogenedentota bacterium]